MTSVIDDLVAVLRQRAVMSTYVSCWPAGVTPSVRATGVFGSAL
jgi:hypothetical protein